MSNFSSDNIEGVAPEIMAALAAANDGAAMPYGKDPATARLEARFAEIFETDVAVFPVVSGTAANALALAAVTPPFGAIFCHEAAHIHADECAAPEFYTGGAKLLALPGARGKLHAAALEAALIERAATRRQPHYAQSAAVSITQASEAGTIYGLEELHAIAEVAHGQDLRLHMDGSRLANALISLDASPADATWRAGVDVLSFGATKNGAMGAEAVIFFDRALAAEVGYRRKRGGHLLSKMRFVTAQLEAYLHDGLWLRNAAHANRMAARLADGLGALAGAEIAYPVEANIVFAHLPHGVIDGLEAAGFGFYRWGGEGRGLIRLVTSYQSRIEDVDALIAAATGLA